MKVDYASLAREYARHRRVRPEVLRNLIDTGELDSDSQVLDVGCGTGNYTIALERAVGCSCWGEEPSEQMLARARERSRSAHFKMGRAEQLDHPAGFFDLVLSVDVIHHVGDRAAHLREAHRVLKNGGRVCTVTDSEEIVRRRQPLSVYFPETVEVDLQRYPRISDLRAMMVEAGFGELREAVVEFVYSLTDIQEYRDKAFSCLHLIPAEAVERGIQRMEQDLRAGAIPCASRYLLLWGTK
jgi:SAM-dependent methyltransferase